MKINKVMEEKLMRKVLVAVDMQNDFIDGALGTPEAQAMLPRMAAKLTAEQARGTVLVFTMAASPTVRTISRRRRGRNCPSSTASAARPAGRLQMRSNPLCAGRRSLRSLPSVRQICPRCSENMTKSNWSDSAPISVSYPTRCSSRHSTQRSPSPSMPPAAPASPRRATRTPSLRCGCVRWRCGERYPRHCWGNVSLYLQ